MSKVINYLLAHNQQLLDIIEKLSHRIVALEDRLGANSSNSSLPPSRDIYKAKRSHRPKSGRKPGGQPGHKPSSYKLQPTDEIINVMPLECSCGSADFVATGHYRPEQKLEIPVIKPYVREYRLHEASCASCGKPRRAKLPEGVSPDLLGAHAKSIISALSGFFQNSKRDVQAIMRDVFNLPISLGLVSKTEGRINKALRQNYDDLVSQAEESANLHMDETSHRCRGLGGWTWVFSNKELCVFKLTSSRGKGVLESMFPEYEGYVNSDRYSVYNHFDASKRQLCWAHLRRDFTRFAHSKYADVSLIGDQLLKICDSVFGYHSAWKAGKIKHSCYRRKMKRLSSRLWRQLQSVLDLRDRERAQRVTKNLLRDFDMMWRFLDNDALEITNNLAERQIRKYVIYRKKNLFTWSERGNQFIERMLSLFMTCKGRQQQAFATLQSLIAQFQISHP